MSIPALSSHKSTRAIGFTLIELLVVIAIISLLSSIVFASLNSARAKARDAKRLQDLHQVYTAIELYFADYQSYPSTGGITTTYADLGCAGVNSSAIATENWVPYVVAKGYIGTLPRDPNPKDQARGSGGPGNCYMYASDGSNFILSAWATIETGPINVNHARYSRAGFREPSIPNQFYLCNHPNIGNPAWGDYYRYSFTITNVDCTW